MARVLVMGTGGVGGCFGAELARAGHDVTFVARGANLEALLTDGLTVTGARGDIVLPTVTALSEPASAGDQDLVLLCVKSYDLMEACRAVEACGGVALTLQNGVDAASRASEVLGDRVLAGTTNVVADLPSPGHVNVLSTYGRITFGEPDGSPPSDRVGRVASWLTEAGLEAVTPPDVRVGLWEKMGNICAMAGLTTLYRASVGQILEAPEGKATFERIVNECFAVGRAAGVDLAEGFVTQRMVWAGGIPYEANSSMARDLERGKPLEVEHLNGYIVRLGRELGVPTPLNEAVYAGVKLAAAAR